LLRDVIVVATSGGLLVCDKASAQQVREVAERMERKR
jgi:hypothetical protein